MKRFMWFALISMMIALTGALLWFRHLQYRTNPLAKEFYNELALSKRETFDLRKIQAVDWDEIVFWSPYADICDYGISGFEKGSLKCRQTDSDGECYLLFLKNNVLVGTVRINRSEIDLTKTGIKNRVPKQRAVFIFEEKTDWPKVRLKGN